jgi:hypothetical protein
VIAMTTHNPALIRLVASRYRDLQGLSTVADAAVLLILAAGAYLHRSGWLDTSSLVAVFIAICAAYFCVRFTRVRRWIDAYYANRCGRVHHSLGRPFPFAMYFQGLLLPQMLRDMGLPVPVGTAFALLLLAGLPGHIVVRDWPYRAHWLLPVAAGVVVAAMFAGVTTHAQAQAWLFPSCFACGASMAFAGLLDHTLLLKTLHPKPSDLPERAPVQAP